jgi:hypothetical protein
VTAVDSAVNSAPVEGGLEGGLADLAQVVVTWLETGVRPVDMLAEDVFADLSVPQWRLQAEGTDATFRLREDNHPQLGTVRVEALDRTSRGFLLKFEERWEAEGQRWYCREMIHCVVTAGCISELAIYCTGDWDESVQRRHAEQVRLARP